MGKFSKAIGGAVKAVAKEVKKAAEPVTQVVKDTASASKGMASGGLKGSLETLGSLSKGDLKGTAGGLLKLGEVGTKGILDTAKASGNLSTGLLANLGSAVGSEDIKKTAANIKREGEKGIDQYGSMAVDVGANALTGGAYGAAKTALQGLQEGGLKGVVNPKNIKSMVMDYAASQAGIDPNALKSAQAAAKGDLKGAALQAAGSYGPINKQSLDVAKAALKGGNVKDILSSPEMKSALASGIGAAKAGMSPEMQGVAKQAIKGEFNPQQYAMQKTGLDQKLQQAKDIRSQAQGMRDQALGMPQQLTESTMEKMDTAKQDLQNQDIDATMEKAYNRAMDARNAQEQVMDTRKGIEQTMRQNSMKQLDSIRQELPVEDQEKRIKTLNEFNKSQMDQFKPSKRGKKLKALLKRGSYTIG